MVKNGVNNNTVTLARIQASIVPDIDGERAFLGAVFLTDPRDDRAALVTAKGNRVENTCVWVTESEEYKLWLSTRREGLWISGGPGKGKTMMSIYLTEHLERAVKGSSDTTVIYFFCDNRDDKRNKAEHILRGWIWQLCQVRPTLRKHGMNELKSRGGRPEKLLSQDAVETLWRVFTAMVCDSAAGTIHCLLDGLDECDDLSIDVITGKLSLLLSDPINGPIRSHQLKLVIISRPLLGHQANAMSRMSRMQRIRLDPDSDEQVTKDLHTFIKQRVLELSEEKDYPTGLRDHVEEVFSEKSEGTFLWVGFAAQDLRKKSNTEVRAYLDSLPAGLEGIYGRILNHIRRFPKDYQETIRSIFHVIVLAYSPLELTRICYLLNIPICKTRPDEPNIGDYVRSCGHFLIVLNNTVKFVHQSASDYFLHHTTRDDPFLEAFRIQPQPGHLVVARACVKDMQSVFERRLGPVARKPDWGYAAKYWFRHARESGDSCQDIMPEVMALVTKGSPLRKFWLDRTIDDSDDNSSGENFLNSYEFSRERGIKPDWHALHVCSLFGLGLAVNTLLKRPSSWAYLAGIRRVSYAGGRYGYVRGMTPLHLAALAGGGAHVSSLLLDKGGHFITLLKDSLGRTALHWAVSDEDLTRVLLQHKANPNSRDKDGDTALHIAAERGHIGTVKLLLSAGATPSAHGEHENTPLHLAATSTMYSERPQEETCRLLVSKGADVDSTNMRNETPLHLAMENMVIQVGRTLLDMGANPNARDIFGLTPLMNYTMGLCLHSAVIEHSEVLQMFLDKHGDIDARDDFDNTCLHHLFMDEPGMLDFVRNFVRCGADIMARNANGQCPLDIWRERGYTKRLSYQQGTELLQGIMDESQSQATGHGV